MTASASADLRPALNRVAEVSFAFWILKIIATTLGETAGDFLAQTLDLGYVAGLGITGTALIAMLAAQLSAARFHPVLFWGAVIATTTAGTESSDMMDRTLGLGYVAGSALPASGLALSLIVWKRREGTPSVDPVATRGAEAMVWIASPTASAPPSAMR